MESKVRKLIETPKQKEAREIQEQEAEEKRGELKKAYNITFSSPEGKMVLRDIMQNCCYQTSEVVINKQTGEICEKSTLYNTMRRTLYLGIRNYVNSETLAAVENQGLEIDEDLFS